MIYADPPYITKAAEYLHDFSPDDHVRLAKALTRSRWSRIVVSYYDHPYLAGLYPSWTVVRCYRRKSLAGQGRRGQANDVLAPEVLLINGASLTLPDDGLFAAAGGCRPIALGAANNAAASVGQAATGGDRTRVGPGSERD